MKFDIVLKVHGMNEVVKRLMDEAQIIDPQNSGVMHISRENFQKYTGLIVKECMAICKESQSAYAKYRKDADDYQDKNIYAEGQAASDTIKYKIKKHFGVEE
jgi:hypothetical protein